MARACRLLKVGRSHWYRPAPDRRERDAPIIARLNEVVGKHGRWGFWKCFHWMRQRGEHWNHKRVWRVYRAMKLNLPRRTKRRLPARVGQPLDVPAEPHRMWAMDFMHDTLFCGKRFRTFNLIDEGAREALAIEIDSSLPAERVVRVLDQIRESRPLPDQIRIDNGPELQSAKLVAWAETNGVRLHYIQPGKPTQNAYIERFNRTFRREVLDAHLFASLSEVREITHEWMTAYNEERPHQALGNVPPSVFSQRTARTENELTAVPNSTSEMCR